MLNIIRLSDLKVGKTGIIKEVNCENIKRRLFDLGFIPNTSITPIFKSIFNDPCAYSVRNIIIALRKSDADQILVFTK